MVDKVQAARDKLKWYNSLSKQRQYMERRRIPGRRTDPNELKKIIRGRNRTNNKEFEVKPGAPVRGQTGISSFSLQEIPATATATITAETAREVKEFDGCLQAVRSKFLYSDGTEAWMTWLEPDDAAITEVT